MRAAASRSRAAPLVGAGKAAAKAAPPKQSGGQSGGGRRRTIVLDDQLTAVGNALKYFGYSFNSVDEKELADAEKLLIDVKPHLFAITSD